MMHRFARPAVRRGLFLAVFALLAPASGLSCGGNPAPEPVRNVLLILVDTLRTDRLGSYGHERDTSPHIDALASRGTLYENCYAQGSNTRYSMLSMMTGLYVTDEEERLPKDYPALAERIRASGRTTAAFVGNQPLAKGSRGYSRGFDHFESPAENVVPPETGNSQEMVRRFKSWYLANKTDIQASTGFFAWVHVMDPHLPYTAPAAYRTRFAGPLPDEERLRQLWSDPAVRAQLPPAAAGREATDIAAMLEANNRYDAEVSRVDDNVGALLDFLQAQGDLDDTLVILAADHGEILWDRVKYPEEAHVWFRKAKAKHHTLMGMYFSDHGWSFHEELWHTPLILAGPGIPAGTRRSGLTANLDIYPTVMQAFGLSPSDDLRGRSLLGGAESRHERVYGYTFFIDAVLDADGWKLVDRRRKLAEVYDPADVSQAALDGAIELFNLKTDPLETHNLASEQPERVAAMLKLLREWKLDNERARDTAPLTDEDVDALIQLGYVQEAQHHGANVEIDGR